MNAVGKALNAAATGAFALLAAFGAARPCAGAAMALGRTQLATRDWVERYVAANGGSSGSYASLDAYMATLDATVETNAVKAADGTVATNYVFTAAYAPTNAPKCVSVSLTFSAPTLALKGAAVETKASAASVLMRLLTSFAYADETAGKWSLEFTLLSGFWKDAAGAEHAFRLDGGMTFRFREDIPDTPPSLHECVVGSDCNCRDKDVKSPSDVKEEDIPEDYRLSNWTTKETMEKLVDPWNWADRDEAYRYDGTGEIPEDVNWVANTADGLYYFMDEDGLWFDYEDMATKCDAWKAAWAAAMKDLYKHVLDCEEAYRKSRVCDAENPQHSWVACGSVAHAYCSVDPKGHGGDGHEFAGESDAAKHFCKCGSVAEAHSFGEWSTPSVSGPVATQTRSCSVCGYSQAKTFQIDLTACDVENGVHVPKTDACGCLCGKYGADGLTSTERKFHKWDGTAGADGYPPCLCKCGQYHAPNAPSAHDVDAGSKCAGVCATCARPSNAGGVGVRDAAEDAHEARTDERCGCRCGRVTSASKLAKFHPQKPGTCKCYGDDGSGGKWHFPSGGKCPGVCGTCGEYRTSDGVTSAPVLATADDHERTDAHKCGCKCGKYDGGADCPERFHQRAGDYDCDCECGATFVGHARVEGHCLPLASQKCALRATGHHFPVNGGKCVGVCHGECGEAKDLSKHTPLADGCGCECGAVGGGSELSKFHNGKGSPACRCVCGRIHTQNPKDGCPAICATCGYAEDGTASPAEKDHSFDADECRCRCGAWVSHRFAEDKCVCRCGATSRAHVWASEMAKTPDGTYYCGTCANEIAKTIWTATCERCGDTVSYGVETGHAADCGKKDEAKGPSYCEKHSVYYDGDECPKCAGTSSGTDGGTSGGTDSTTQSEDPFKIL